MKHKVGDKVRIRKDLVLGELYGSCLFVGDMQNLCGKTVRITKVNEALEHYHIDSSRRYWTDEMFEDKDVEVQGMHKGVTISVVENKVIAYCDGKIGVARCHPDDDFDFFVGAKLALERLEEAEKPYAWLKDGVIYYVPSVIHTNLYDSHMYDTDVWDERFMKRGIVFKTKEEAIECAKKMLEVVKREG